ncbi:MAG: hypothetical protein GY898_15485 [Proteobacteria bacterium]|nr:hypothetical protein [Pseudomonadota bacterium]
MNWKAGAWKSRTPEGGASRRDGAQDARRKHTWAAGVLALSIGLAGSAAAEDEGVAGTVVSIDGETYVVDLADETSVSVGSVLQVYRRLPGPRGTAAYRESALWWEIGKLTVAGMGEGVAVATYSGAGTPLPAGLDESGAPADQVHVGDRVRATAAVAQRPAPVRVTFALRELYGPEDLTLQGEGAAMMAEWLRGLRSIEGPISVEVHPRIAELGDAPPDGSRELSLTADAPFGPAPGEPTVPVEGLYEDAPKPTRLPDGREVMVVDNRDGKPDVWHYLDPVTLAARRGEKVAEALAAHLGVDPGTILVRVVPRPTSAYDLAHKTPGYDAPEDQIRILATGIDWSDPPPKRRRSKPKVEEEPAGEEEVPKVRRRRLLEKVPPEDVS